MGKHFGNLQKLKGVTYYVLSPNELKPFGGMLNPGFPNLMRKLYNNLFRVGFMGLIAYTVYEYSMNDYHKSLRKNPDDYKNDV